jgi:hypothetical protein
VDTDLPTSSQSSYTAFNEAIQTLCTTIHGRSLASSSLVATMSGLRAGIGKLASAELSDVGTDLVAYCDVMRATSTESKSPPDENVGPFSYAALRSNRGASGAPDSTETGENTSQENKHMATDALSDMVTKMALMALDQTQTKAQVRYMAFGGKVRSRIDGQEHIVKPTTVRNLYKVPRARCIIAHNYSPRVVPELVCQLEGLQDVVVLHPREDGLYMLPEPPQPWYTSTVKALALEICKKRLWHQLPILADALQDADYPHEHVLKAFREHQPFPLTELLLLRAVARGDAL